MIWLASGLILIAALFIAYQLSKGKSKKRKYIVWGITTILAIAPTLSFLVGWLFVFIFQDPWAGIGTFALALPVTIIIGIVILLIGIFTKKQV